MYDSWVGYYGWVLESTNSKYVGRTNWKMVAPWVLWLLSTVEDKPRESAGISQKGEADTGIVSLNHHYSTCCSTSMWENKCNNVTNCNKEY